MAALTEPRKIKIAASVNSDSDKKIVKAVATDNPGKVPSLCLTNDNKVICGTKQVNIEEPVV